MSDDSDFGFGLLSPLLDDDEPSTTTAEAVIDNRSEREQQGAEGKNKDNKKL